MTFLLQVVENLRSYLMSDELANAAGVSTHTALETIPLVIGSRFRRRIIGTGGYVMNRAGLSLFISSINKTNCSPNTVSSMEDGLISDCMKSNGAKIPITERDGKQRFSRFSPTIFYTQKIARFVGTKCCIEELISLHYMRPWEMEWFYCMLYGVQ